MVDANKLLIELEETEKQIKFYTEKKMELLKKIKTDVYTSVAPKDKITIDELILVIEWDLDYNHYYVGEHGMHSIETQGIKNITEEQFNQIKTLIENEEFTQLGKYLDQNIMLFKNVILMNTLSDAEVEIENDIIHFEWNFSNDDDCSMNKDSFIRIHKILKSRINDVENKYEKIAP